MKVIDLLNKIANGEEVPNKIKHDNYIYYLTDGGETYIGEYHHTAIGRWNCLDQCLNDEIEIIEEPKKIEKFEFSKSNTNSTEDLYDIENKLNEIIDFINRSNNE